MPTSPSHWTLRAKLLASVLALFTVVMLATSALTVLMTRSYLTTQLGKDLQGASNRVQDFRRGFDADGDGRVAARRARSAPPAAATCSSSRSTPDGSVVTAGGVVQNAVVNDQGADDALDSAQVSEVSEAATSSSPDAGRGRRRRRQLPRLDASSCPTAPG